MMHSPNQEEQAEKTVNHDDFMKLRDVFAE
jgi:hypothetical protein